MAKIITVALVVIMLVVGFGIGLIASPFLMAQNSYFKGEYEDCIRELDYLRKKPPMGAYQASMGLLLSTCLEHVDLFYEALRVLDVLSQQSEFIDISLVNMKKAMIKKRMSQIHERL